MQNQLTRDLANNKIFDGYMFYGDSFLVDYFISLVSKKLDTDGQSITKIYFDEYDFSYCKNRLLESSLFNPRNILIIKTEKTIPKKELDELMNSANANKDSFLIIGCYGENDFKAMDSNFKKVKNGYSLRCFSPNPSESLGILNEFAKENHLKCSGETLMHLLNFHKNDLNLCVNDIKKLAILNEEITSKTIDNHCFSMTSVNFDDLFYAFFMKQDISNELKFALESGDNLILFLNQLISNTQQILMINSYIKLNGSINLLDVIGYNPPQKIANQKTQIATKYKTQTILAVLETLQAIELNMKSSKIDDKDGYFYAAIRGISVLL